jgi:hypothetical protein
MRTLPSSFVALALVCLAGGTAPRVHAASFSEAQITRVHEDVKVLKEAAKPRSAQAGERVLPVTTVATGANSRAELRFPDKSLTRLGANSRFTLQGQGRTLDLAEGVMMLQVPKKQGGAKVRTAAVTAAVTGTTIIIEFHPGGVIKLIVVEGECVLSLNNDPTKFQVVGAGMAVTTHDGNHVVPEPYYIDLKKLLQTSNLLNGDNPNQNQIADAVGVQQLMLKDGELSKANFQLPNGLILSLHNRNDVGSLNAFNQAQIPVVKIIPPPPQPPKNNNPPPPRPTPPPPPPPVIIVTPPPNTTENF